MTVVDSNMQQGIGIEEISQNHSIHIHLAEALIQFLFNSLCSRSHSNSILYNWDSIHSNSSKFCHFISILHNSKIMLKKSVGAVNCTQKEESKSGRVYLYKCMLVANILYTFHSCYQLANQQSVSNLSLLLNFYTIQQSPHHSHTHRVEISHMNLIWKLLVLTTANVTLHEHLTFQLATWDSSLRYFYESMMDVFIAELFDGEKRH